MMFSIHKYTNLYVLIHAKSKNRYICRSRPRYHFKPSNRLVELMKIYSLQESAQDWGLSVLYLLWLGGLDRHLFRQWLVSYWPSSHGQNDYIDITCTLRRLKPPTTRQFCQQLVQANKKEMPEQHFMCFETEIPRSSFDSQHKRPVIWKWFRCYDVIVVI